MMRIINYIQLTRTNLEGNVKKSTKNYIMVWLDDRYHDSKSIQNDCKILEEKSKIINKKPTKEYFYLSTAFLIIWKIFRNTPFNKKLKIKTKLCYIQRKFCEEQNL